MVDDAVVVLAVVEVVVLVVVEGDVLVSVQQKQQAFIQQCKIVIVLQFQRSYLEWGIPRGTRAQDLGSWLT